MDLSSFKDLRLANFANRLVSSYLSRSVELPGRRLLQLGDEYFGDTFSEGLTARPQLYEWLQAIFNAYTASEAAYGNEGGKLPDRSQLVARCQELEHQVSLLPTHTLRTADKIDFQQFSTPPAYALLAAVAANLRADDAVLEPSAGLGGLAVMSRLWGVQHLVVNEIDDARRELLDQVLRPTVSNLRVLAFDGGQLHLHAGTTIHPMDVVIMNPPFSLDQGREDPFTAARHVESALSCLRPGGRLVAILPGGFDGRGTESGESLGMASNAPRFKEWWKTIALNYTVRCDIGIAGGVYKKFGTTVRTRLVVIDKVGRHPQGLKALRWVNGGLDTAATFHEPVELLNSEEFWAQVVNSRSTTGSEGQRAIAAEMEANRPAIGKADKLLKFMTPVTDPHAALSNLATHGTVTAPAEVVRLGAAIPEAPKTTLDALALLTARVKKSIAVIEEPRKVIDEVPTFRLKKTQVDFKWGGKMCPTYDRVVRLLEAHGLNDKLFQQDLTAVTLEHSPYQDLAIEAHAMGLDGNEWQLILTHYYDQNGDRIADGEVVFRCFKDKGILQLEETAVQHPRGGEARGLDPNFARVMVSNITDQGYARARIKRERNDPFVDLNAEDELFEGGKERMKATLDALAEKNGSAAIPAEPFFTPEEEEVYREHRAAGVGLTHSGLVAKGELESPLNKPDEYVADEFYVEPVAVTAQIQVVPDDPSADQSEGENTMDVFHLYQPYATIEGAHPHNVALVESNTMRLVNLPIATAPVHLCQQVIESGALSAVQIENVVYAINAHAQRLRDGVTRKAFFIGDGTGVGKGRSAAAIALHYYYEMAGKVRVLWVTKEFSLIQATRRDWADLGGNPDFVFSQQPFRDEQIPLDAGILVTTYSTMRMAGNPQDLVNQKSEDQLAQEWEQYERQVIMVNVARQYRTAWKNRQKVYGYYSEPDVHELLAWTNVGVEPPLPGQMDMPLIPSPKKPKQAKPSVNRLQQIIDWNPDVILCDESHSLGNAIGKAGGRGGKTTSQQGVAGLELLAALPDARVVFLSATGATEVHNLGYAAERMGLCGPEVPAFPSVQEFINKISRAGMLGMELVAKDMKSLGLYRATNLSYAGTSFELLEHKLAAHQRQLYDESCYYWRQAYDYVKRALEENQTDKKGKAVAMSQFWGAAQRFYNQILISMQAPTAIAYALTQLRAGHSVVVQLVNTNEAATERVVADALLHETDLNDLDITPKDALVMFVRTSFPTIQYEVYLDENLNEKVRMCLDSNGDPVQNPEAIRLREELIGKILQMRAPQGALDAFLEQVAEAGFPAAEITGRGRRYLMKEVTGKDGSVSRQRVVEARNKAICDAEAAAFMNDDLRVLIFSDAGNTGRSFQSDLRCKNTRRRIHIVLQPGWQAAGAIQGMGRTHRTNQRVPPHYVLVTTDMPGQKRFVTSIARRIEQLGSLTKGNRKAANSGLFADTDNLETRYALAAIHQIFRALWSGTAQDLEDRIGCSFFELQDYMGLSLVDDSKEPPQLKQDALPSVTTFLNRLLFLPTTLQEQLFAVFETLHASAIDNAKQQGFFDHGVEKIVGETITKLSDKLVSVDPSSGARTRLVRLKVVEKRTILTFAEMMAGKFVANNEKGYSEQSGKPVALVRNTKSGNLFAVWDAGMGTTKAGEVVQMLRVCSSTSTTRETPQEYGKHSLVQMHPVEFEQRWDREAMIQDKYGSRDYYLVTGSILPVWDKLGSDASNDAVRIYVAETTPEAGQPSERIIGRYIPARDLEGVLINLGVTDTGVRLSTDELIAEVLTKGNTLYLANDWRLQRRRLQTGAYRMVVNGVPDKHEIQNVPGIVGEVDGRDFIYIVGMPADVGARRKIFEAFTRHRPCVKLGRNGTIVPIINQEAEAALHEAEKVPEVASYDFGPLVRWEQPLGVWPPVAADAETSAELVSELCPSDVPVVEELRIPDGPSDYATEEDFPGRELLDPERDELAERVLANHGIVIPPRQFDLVEGESISEIEVPEVEPVKELHPSIMGDCPDCGQLEGQYCRRKGMVNGEPCLPHASRKRIDDPEYQRKMAEFVAAGEAEAERKRPRVKKPVIDPSLLQMEQGPVSVPVVPLEDIPYRELTSEQRALLTAKLQATTPKTTVKYRIAELHGQQSLF